MLLSRESFQADSNPSRRSPGQYAQENGSGMRVRAKLNSTSPSHVVTLVWHGNIIMNVDRERAGQFTVAPFFHSTRRHA